MTSLIPNIFKEKNNRLVFCSILILSGFPILSLIAGFICLENKKIMFKQTKRQFIFLLIIILSYFYGYLTFGIHSSGSLINIISSVFIFTNNTNFSDRRLELRFINFYIVANSLFFFFEIFNVTNFNNRFETFFIEPSYLAIISGYLLIRLGLNSKTNIQMVTLMLLIFISKSITGVIFILYYVISNRKHIHGQFIIFVLPLLLFTSFYFLESTYIIERIANISSDLSAIIRVFFPLLVIKGIYDNNGALGTGYGYLDDFLIHHYKSSTEFDFFLKKDFYGNVMYNTNIDNVYYYILASLGVLGFLFCMYITIYSLKKNGWKFTVITLILGFSMGFLTLPIFINRFLFPPKWIKY